jgi:hypothetical protein
LRAGAAHDKVPRHMASFEPVPFAQRSEGQKVIIGAVIPALVGALAGFLVGASAAGYWVVAILAGVGALLGGFEHDGGWDAADRGFFGGVIYGTTLLLVHELIHNQAKVSLGNFPPFLVVITALAGTLLSAAGGRLARGRRGADAVSGRPA